ncbi:MAG: DUF4852 domain-containing protein [Alphaproteobacteria bacterium]|nr:DUF4852 domain-containing protein [Alphaproteobacteria bacterium]
MMRINTYKFALIAMLALAMVSTPLENAKAQEKKDQLSTDDVRNSIQPQDINKDMMSESITLDENTGFVEGKPKSQRKYIYERPTMASLSHLYWTLGLLDLENKEYIDDFLRINECRIYQNYYSREFEWNEIRDATVKFIKENKDDFPVRFELVIPIRLKDYDTKRHAFQVLNEDQILVARRFEVGAPDARRTFCGNRKAIEGYPGKIIVEFSRPVSISYIPAPVNIAEQYIQRIDKIAKSNSNITTKNNLYNIRTAFIILQFKIFSHRGIIRQGDFYALQTSAVLEGIEIYGDERRTELFYTQSYLRKDSDLSITSKFESEYKILNEKHKADGVFY